MEHTEINTIQLRKVLTNFSEELEMSFLEKRSKNNSHKQDPLEELNDVIKELTDRERQLQASIGIAKMLLDNNQLLSQQLEETRTKKKEYSAQFKSLKYELDTTKDDLLSHIRKSQSLNEALIRAEEQILKFSSENNRLKNEHRRKKLSISISENEKLEELHNELNKEISVLRKSKQENLHEIKILEEKISELEETNFIQTHTNEKLEKTNYKINEKLRITEEELHELKGRLVAAEASLYNTQTRYSRALKQVKGLEEEIEVFQNCKSQSSIRVLEKSDRSLMDELEELNYEHSTLGSDRDRDRKKEPRVSETLGNIDLPGKIEETRDICEEYFMLSAQSIKLNSSYMDVISIVPIQMLYKKAITLEIPFHKWYDWIKDELNSVYIHILYQQDLKMKADKKLLKK